MFDPQSLVDISYAQGQSQRALRVFGVTESSLVGLMERLTAQFPDAKLFSLPRLGTEFQIEIGFRGRGDLDTPFDALVAGVDELGVRYELVEE